MADACSPALLFNRDKSTVSRHLKNIIAEEELEQDSVVEKQQQLPQTAKSIWWTTITLSQLFPWRFRTSFLRQSIYLTLEAIFDDFRSQKP